jgi:hypothetical protein
VNSTKSVPPIVRFGLMTLAAVLALLLIVGQGGPIPWTETEWLISYDGGFVRRGLAGTVIAFLHSSLGIDAHVTIAVLSYILFAAVAVALVARIGRMERIDLLTLVILLFLPSLVLFQAIDPGGFGRKEGLFVLLFALNLVLVERVLAARWRGEGQETTRWYSTRGAVLLNLIAIPIALTHEAILFAVIPVSVLVTARAMDGISTRPHLRALMFWSPAMIAAGSGFIWNGSSGVADAICRDWVARGVPDCLGDARAIGAIGWTGKELFHPLSGRLGQAIGEAAVWGLVIGICCILLAVATSRVFAAMSEDERSHEAGSDWAVAGSVRVVGRYLILPLLAAIPLWVFALDWGRWFWVAAVCYALVLTSPRLLAREVGPARTSRTAPSTWRWVLAIGRGSRALAGSPAAWVLALYASLVMRLPHCCLTWNALTGGLVKSLVDVFR